LRIDIMSATEPTSKPLIAELRGTRQRIAPTWLMRQAGRYLPEYRRLRASCPDFLTFCYTPDLAVEAALQPIRRYGFDAAILFSDILVVPDALGRQVRFVEGEGPVLEPVRDRADIARLGLDRLDEHLEPVFEAVRRLSGALDEDTALIGFAGSPWTIAVYLIEGRGGTKLDRVRCFAWQEPELFAELIELLTEATARYLLRQIRAGAEVVQLFDSWAGVLSCTQFRSWVIEPTRRIAARVKEVHDDVPVIGFARGCGVNHYAYATETALDAIGLDAGVPLDWASQVLQPQCAVQGNLDNALLTAGGAALDQEAIRILSSLGAGRFVFNLGHGILPDTPPEHVAQLMAAVRGWDRGV
jgi:uroporphyrinogen decarboxylase